MAKFSRDKGQRAERQVVALLQGVVNVAHVAARELWAEHKDTPWPLDLAPATVKRNTTQSDRGGYDIVGLPYLAVEVKHQEQFALAAWWKQTVEQAGENQHPVLFYRRNNLAWRVRMVGTLPKVAEWVELTQAPVDMDTEPFLSWLHSAHVVELLHLAKSMSERAQLH